MTVSHQTVFPQLIIIHADYFKDIWEYGTADNASLCHTTGAVRGKRATVSKVLRYFSWTPLVEQC